MRGIARVAASLFVIYLFFFEYLPPFHQVHIPFDLEEYYYPLTDYAFQALHKGRFPLWDPSVYTGMSFLANPQSELFYPPAWLMFALRWNHDRLSYQAMQNLMIAHVWLAFVLCYLWLRGKRLTGIAAFMGASVFAFSGWMCTWIQHIGISGAFAWLPLGLWGIDQAVECQSWRPLWKLALASAMGFLAGYPPAWFVSVVLCAVYALASELRIKTVIGAAVAGVLSLLLVAVQILPTMETSALRAPEARYDQMRDPVLLLNFLTPNSNNNTIGADAPENVLAYYFYLGAPAVAALLLMRRRMHGAWPACAMLAATLIVILNPFGWVSFLVYRSELVADVARSLNFLAGFTLSAALLTALGIDAFLKNARPVSSLFKGSILAALSLWIVFDLVRWFGAASFPMGWHGWYDLVVPTMLVLGGLALIRASSTSVVPAVLLALFVLVNFKVLGTSKRFNAVPGSGTTYRDDSYFAMDAEAYRTLLAYPRQRILIDRQTGPMPARLRHVGLQTPQGFDPFLSAGLRTLLTNDGATFTTDREFEINPADSEMLQLLGVRFFITGDEGPMYSKLAANPRFRFVGQRRDFYRIFEYLDAREPYRWAGEAKSTEWTPERRAFLANSPGGGEFVLAEQFHPRWTATVDGMEVPVRPWKNAFHAVTIPPGSHTLIFEFRPRWQTGAILSLIGLVILAAWIVWAQTGISSKALLTGN